MATEPIRVQMLGGFTIRRGDNRVDDQSNRMRKVWLLLAYLIYHRSSTLTQEHFLNLLRSKGEDGADPAGNLKALFYRARTLLNQLDGSAGHELIIRKGGSYQWNPDIPLELDVERFEQLCRSSAAAETEEDCLTCGLQAIALYGGDFLPKLSSEAWAMPIAAYYHRLYLETVEKALDLLTRAQRWEEAANLCARALQIEPYSEALYQQQMRSKLALGDRAAVLTIYENMSELLFANFGIMPSDESRALYREAGRATEDTSLPAGLVRDLLREPDAAKGALFCEYDFFKLLYQAQARALIRSGDVIHIGLFSVRGVGDKPLARRSLDRAMENLKELVVANLRQGDVVTKCSVSQLIVMLPQANYENSCAVCQRLIRAFGRQYPHSPAEIHFSVQPLEPMAPPPRT